MDPITQGALGAVAGQIFSKHKNNQLRQAKGEITSLIAPISLMAALAGMSPDLDVLIRSNQDPLLFLIYHRQFTHSLFFIPFGALICSLVLHPLIGRRHHFSVWQSYGFCFVGYATHALIDACTTYGTLLLWPFSHERFAWNTIAVVDFFYTLPILLAVFLGIKLNSPWPARIIFIWVLFYPYLGHLQGSKAEKAAHIHLQQQSVQLANANETKLDINAREDTDIWKKADGVNTNDLFSPPPYSIIYKLSAKPSMSNLVLWKIIYETDDRFYIDAIRVGVFDSPEDAIYFPGDSIEKLDIQKDFPWLDQNSQQAKDIERFSWFSMGYVAKDLADLIHKDDFKEPEKASSIRVMDIRYSIVPNEISPLWSIGLDDNAAPEQHASYDNHRDASSEKRNKFFKLLFGP